MEEPTPDEGSWDPKFVRIGGRVGRSGQVFETDGRAGLGGLVVKLFTWAAGLPAQVVQDFTREAMRVADLHHPHVAQVLDAGTLGDGTPFVVMERLAGMTLDEAVGARSLPMTEVLPILRGVGSALFAAHAVGVAHGELRADNVFIADIAPYGPGCPKLLDFGVARLVTRSHAIGRGAHELGRRAGERADQLALATLAWRLLGATPAPAIQRVLLRAMSPDPRQRFGSITALVVALEEASANTATAGLPTNAGAVRTLVGASIPGPTPASAPPSLTQQFFAEGEQLEMEHAAGETSDAQAVAERDEEGPVETGAAPRVPRSRAQMAAAALLALGSAAIIGWTVVSLASKPAGDLRAADASPATVAARPVVVSPAGTLRPTRAPDRGQGRKMIPVRRAPGAQPPPFVAPARSSSVTAAEAVPRTDDQAAPLPSVAPAGSSDESSDDDEPQPAEQEGGEPHDATPAPRAPEGSVLAPGASGDVPPAPSAAEAPAPPAPAP